jgi:hypothetical protein
MKALAASVALAVIAGVGCSGESSDAESRSLSVSVAPLIAVPPQATRIEVRTTGGGLYVIALIRRGTSRCAVRWLGEWRAARVIDDARTRRGTDVLRRSVRPHAGPGTYRVCAYLDTRSCAVTACGNDPLKLPVATATATFGVRALNRVMRTGRGIGPWRLRQRLVRRPGFLRSSYRDETKPLSPCRRSFLDAARVDRYGDGLMLAWAEGNKLVGVRTTLRGDRSDEGFVIGTSRLSSIRARHHGIRLEGSDWRSSATMRMLVVPKQIAAGAAEIRYLFDSRGILFALETSERRC